MTQQRSQASELAARLTTQEWRVAASVGYGATNKAVARDLQVSVKTIEYHLANIYRKVGVKGRSELAHLVGSLTVAPPTGTVTFLFAGVDFDDVAPSRTPRLLREAVSTSELATRRSIMDAGGFVFELSRDGIGGSFPSPVQAATAAVACQAAARAPHAWGRPVPLRVALHTGLAEMRAAVYVGSAVPRARWVAALARPGQVLASASAATLLADEDWTLVDLGRHDLDADGHSEHLFRLRAPSMTDVALPPRAGGGRLGNLPRERGKILGRDREVGRVQDALTDHQVVSVTGTGGVGKTRLALAAARCRMGQFRHGVWFVELGHVLRSSDVMPATVTALGLKIQGRGDSAAAIAAALSDQERLLVLDNCEHVLDGVRLLVNEIVGSCAGVRVLTTSRERLGVDREHVVVLAPLRVDADSPADRSVAAELFIERATDALGAFEPGIAEVGVIEDICQRLDGLPLAIELAAARLPGMNLDHLDAALDDRFRTLSHHRGAHQRHQSLRTTIAWSYDSLTKVEQLLMDRLSVLPGSFDLEAAAAVADDLPFEGTILRQLDVLVGKSLLSTTPWVTGARFDQLETLREFGRQRLAARGSEVASRQRHADHFRQWAERADEGIRSGDESAWHQAMVTDWPNLRTAVHTACANDDADTGASIIRAVLWWSMSRARVEVGEWADAVRALPSAWNCPLRPVLTSAAAHFTLLRGDGAHASALLVEAREEEQRLGLADEPWVAVVSSFLPQTGDPLAAPREVQRRGGDIGFWRVLGLQQECVIRAFMVAHLDLAPRDAAAHLDRIRVGRAVADEVGNLNGIAYAAMTLGTALHRRQPDEAIALLQEAIDIATPLELEITVGQARRQLAALYVGLHRSRDALALVRPAISQHLRSGAGAELRVAVGSCLLAFADLGRYEFAATIAGALKADHPSNLERGTLAHLDHQISEHLEETEINRLRREGDSIGLVGAVDRLLGAIDEVLS